MRFRTYSLAVLWWLAPYGSGCTLDTHDLDAFQTTAAGPEKLHAIVRDGSHPDGLRAEAALRLLDLERADVDGRALLFDALGALSTSARERLLPGLVAGLHARMRTAVGEPPSPRAIRAKDAGARLLGLLDASARAALGHALVQWVGEDPTLRADCGGSSLESLAAQVGGESARASAERLTATLPAGAVARLSLIVEQRGDAKTRALAADKLLEIERSLRALPARHEDLRSTVLPALGRFADLAGPRARLVTIAGEAGTAVEERTLALELLSTHTTAAELPALSTLALDPATPLSLRALALARLGETRARESLPTLLQLAGERARELRQPAVELAIVIGGERVLSAIFRSLPHQWNVTYARSELEAYGERLAALPVTNSLTALLGAKLYSIFWWNRVLAIRWLAQRADAAEATWRLRLHVDDRQEVLGEGWPPKHTIGREASAALRSVATRS